MSIVIKVENLSKRYRIGLKEKQKDTLFEQIGSTLRGPIENFRKLRSLSKFRKEDESVFWALRDINFEVQQGEVLGIIGHNGAGKSTLLKILSRITEPTNGQISVKGRIGALLEVGTGFHPELTGRENIYMNGTILGMTRKEIDRKLDEIVDFFGVEKYIDTPVKFYSSGMNVRLGFAIAAHLEPEILVIDEVLAVGDAEFQKKCLGKMEYISESGRTILFVSHDMASIEKLCPTTLLIDKGEVAFFGDTKSAISHYLYNKSAFAKNMNSKHIKDIQILSCLPDGRKITPNTGGSFFIDGNVVGIYFAKTVVLGFAISSNSGQKICTSFSDYHFHTFKIDDDDELSFQFHDTSLFLSPGEYFIEIYLYIDGILKDTISDWIEVQIGDPFGNGYKYFQKQGPILSSGIWKSIKNKTV